MTTAQDILDFIKTEARSIRPTLPDELPEQALFHADLKLDSLDIVELVARIEQRYDFLVPDQDLSQFTSLNATVVYVLRRGIS